MVSRLVDAGGATARGGMKRWLQMWRTDPSVRLAVLLLLALTGFRLWYCTYNDLTGDEAYYFLWSKHLDAAYFSKGPAIAWTIAFGTAVAGDTVFGVRWLSVLLSAGTGWQLFVLMRRLSGGKAALETMALAALVPLFAVGSVLMTIDPISVFFWVWAMNLLLDWMEDGRSWRGAALGFAVGCGFLAKFVNALQFIGIIGFLATQAGHRRLLRSRGAVLGLLSFAVCATPILWWNAHHGWITASHLQHRGALDAPFRFHPREFLQFWEQQLLVLSPLLAVALFAALAATAARRGKASGERLLLWMSAPVFLFYIILAVNDAGEANWTAAGIPAALGLTVLFWRRVEERSSRWRWFWLAAIVLAAAESGVMHDTRILKLPLKRDPMRRVRGWQSLGEDMDFFRPAYPGALLIANNYQVAGLIHFYCADRPVTYLPRHGEKNNQFSFWPQYEVGPETLALYVTEADHAVPEELRRDFSRIEMVWEFDTVWRHRPLKHFEVYCCRP